MRIPFSGGVESSGDGRRVSRPGISLVAAGILLAGCTSGDTSAEAPAAGSESGPETVDTLYGMLNYDGLTANGLCQNGGARPCFAPIRTEPAFVPEGENQTKNYMNPGEFTVNAEGEREYASVSWPYEAGAGRPGDELKIVCRVEGPKVQGADPAIASTVWAAVAIPAEISASGEDEVGYTPERWLRLPPNFIIDACSEAENPANAPLALTPTV